MSLVDLDVMPVVFRQRRGRLAEHQALVSSDADGRALPAPYGLALAAILGGYLVLTQLVKSWLIRRFGLSQAPRSRFAVRFRRFRQFRKEGS